MELTLSSRDGFVVAATKGVIDESARDSLREHLHPLVGKKGARLIVDLSGSPRIDSAGIGNLVALTLIVDDLDAAVARCREQ